MINLGRNHIIRVYYLYNNCNFQSSMKIKVKIKQKEYKVEFELNSFIICIYFYKFPSWKIFCAYLADSTVKHKSLQMHINSNPNK